MANINSYYNDEDDDDANERPLLPVEHDIGDGDEDVDDNLNLSYCYANGEEDDDYYGDVDDNNLCLALFDKCIWYCYCCHCLLNCLDYLDEDEWKDLVVGVVVVCRLIDQLFDTVVEDLELEP